jgi:parvulin-like peptidyl-prolyl isomerase
MGAFPRLPAFGCGLVAAVWGVLASAALAGPDDVVASVGGAEIRAREIEVVLKRLGLAEMAEPEQGQRAAAAVLEQIIDERVLRAELAAAGIDVPAAEVDAAVARVREQVAGRGLEFEAFLAQTGRTPVTIRDQVALEIALDRYVSPRITPAAVAEVFDRNRRELDGTKLRVSHILLRPESGGDDDPAAALLDEARTLRQEILQGRLSFGEAARRHSAGPSRRREGDIGWISREGPLLDAFASEVYSLAKGGVSEPFVTPFGVHLATVTAIEPGRIGIDAVRSRIEKMLASQVVRELVLQGRARNPVEFAPGVPHFDPTTVGAPPARRPVVIDVPGEG